MFLCFCHFRAQPDEIAQTITYLAADQTGLITGAFIPVDGGLHLA